MNKLFTFKSILNNYFYISQTNAIPTVEKRELTKLIDFSFDHELAGLDNSSKVWKSSIKKGVPKIIDIPWLEKNPNKNQYIDVPYSFLDQILFKNSNPEILFIGNQLNYSGLPKTVSLNKNHIHESYSLPQNQLINQSGYNTYKADDISDSILQNPQPYILPLFIKNSLVIRIKDTQIHLVSKFLTSVGYFYSSKYGIDRPILKFTKNLKPNPIKHLTFPLEILNNKHITFCPSQHGWPQSCIYGVEPDKNLIHVNSIYIEKPSSKLPYPLNLLPIGTVDVSDYLNHYTFRLDDLDLINLKSSLNTRYNLIKGSCLDKAVSNHLEISNDEYAITFSTYCLQNNYKYTSKKDIIPFYNNHYSTTCKTGYLCTSKKLKERFYHPKNVKEKLSGNLTSSPLTIIEQTPSKIIRKRILYYEKSALKSESLLVRKNKLTSLLPTNFPFPNGWELASEEDIKLFSEIAHKYTNKQLVDNQVDLIIPSKLQIFTHQIFDWMMENDYISNPIPANNSVMNNKLIPSKFSLDVYAEHPNFKELILRLFEENNHNNIFPLIQAVKYLHNHEKTCNIMIEVLTQIGHSFHEISYVFD